MLFTQPSTEPHHSPTYFQAEVRSRERAMGEARKPGEGWAGSKGEAWTPSFDGGKEHKKSGFRGAWVRVRTRVSNLPEAGSTTE